MPPKTVFLTLALLLGIGGVPHQAPPAGGPDATTVFRVHVTTDDGDADGTSVLIHRDNNGREDVLYFLTSSRLFKTPDNEREAAIHAVRVLLPDGRALDVDRRDLFVAGGALADVALLRVTTMPASLPTRPVSYDAPPIDTVFLIAGFDEHGEARTIAERVRFESTLLLVGDRDVSSLNGCVGAPAISQTGVFGVVRECQHGRAPIISLLPEARAFIERTLPRPTTTTITLSTPQFDLVDRQMIGPLLHVGTSAVTTGEVSVPFEIGAREALIDATASLTNLHELRFADVTILNLEDRSVRLRFTLGGIPPLLAPPLASSDLPGQALVTLHLKLAVARDR
jgi:hypothetical protein